MRKSIALAVLAAAAATLVPATSASASCIDIGIDRCVNACTEAAGAYRDADRAAGGALPNLPFNCTL